MGSNVIWLNSAKWSEAGEAAGVVLARPDSLKRNGMAARSKKTKKKAQSVDKKKRGHRPRFKPTDEQKRVVRQAVGFGMPQEQIATLITNPETSEPISPVTLRERFKPEISVGKAHADFNVATSLYKKAINDKHPQSATCCIWWTKSKMGWRGEDKHIHEIDVKSVTIGPPVPEQRELGRYLKELAEAAEGLLTDTAAEEVKDDA